MGQMRFACALVGVYDGIGFDKASPQRRQEDFMLAGWQDSWRQPENRIRLAVLATAVLLFILLIAVAIQSWFVDWPGRLWLTLAVGGAVALSLLLARIWSPAPLTIAVISWAVLLLVSTYLYGSDSDGLGILGLPFDILIAGLFLLATGLAAFWLIRLTRLPLWARVLVVALAAYAWLPVILALAKRQPFASAVRGLWPMPYWLQGVFLGTDLLLPAAWPAPYPPADNGPGQSRQGSN